MSYRIFLLGLIKSFALANFDTFELLRNVYNRVQFTPPTHTHTLTGFAWSSETSEATEFAGDGHCGSSEPDRQSLESSGSIRRERAF